MRGFAFGIIGGLALAAVFLSDAAAWAPFAQLTQAEIRQREFIAREVERQRAEDRARYDRIERENAELRAMIQQVADRVSSPTPTSTTAEARENALEARYAAAAILIDGSEQERQAVELIAAGNVRDGLALLEASASQETDAAADRWRRLGTLAFEADVELALRAFTQVVRLDPTDVGSRAQLALLQMRTGDIAGARTSAETAVANAVLDRDKAAAYLALGAVQMMQGDQAATAATFALAVEAAEAAHAASPSAETIALLLNIRMQRIMLASQSLDTESMDADLAALEVLMASPQMQVEGDSPEARMLRDDIAAMRMLPMMRTGDFESAIAIATESLNNLLALKQEHPDLVLLDMRLWDRNVGLGSLYMMSGDAPAAIAAFERAEQIARTVAERDPNDIAKQLMWAGSALQFASMRMMTGDVQTARAQIADVDARLTEIAARDPDNSQLQIMRAMSLAFLGLIDFALQQEGVVPERDPQETVREARALAAPHIEAGRVPPMMQMIFAMVDMVMPPE